MASPLRLYRGDFEKIREFTIHKTNKFCLVGKGIYLTDSLKIAQTYRTKGMRLSRNEYPIDLLGYGRNHFAHMGEAMETIFSNYLERAWERERQSSFGEASAKAKELFRVIHLDIFDRLKASGMIKIETNRDYGKKEVTAKAVWRTSDRDHGYLSVFDFDNTDGCFDQRVVNLSKRITRPEIRRVLSRISTLNPDRASEDEYVRYFDDILFEHDLYSTLYCGRNSFPECPSTKIDRDRVVVTGKKGAKKKRQRRGPSLYNQMASKLKDAGFLGFEYMGGMVTYSGNIHRAFCIWDDDFVNEHFVKRL